MNTCAWAVSQMRLKYPELPLLRTLYDDVLYRDIATRYRIEEVRALKELAFYLMSNPAGQVSFNKLKEQFRLGSVNTIKNYIEYLENSWLIFTLNVYDYSVKRQQIAAKKVYSIDTGLANAIGFSIFLPTPASCWKTLAFPGFAPQTQRDLLLHHPGGLRGGFLPAESRQLIQVAQNLSNPATTEP